MWALRPRRSIVSHGCGPRPFIRGSPERHRAVLPLDAGRTSITTTSSIASSSPAGTSAGSMTAGALPQREDGPVEVSGISTDITERKEAERALELAYEEIQALKIAP